MTIDAAKFRKLRETNGLSQNRLADISGVSQTTIDKIERGETKNSRMISRLARALGVSVEDLDTETPEGYRAPPALFAPGHRLPVYAAAEGGNGHMIIDASPIDYLPRPQMFEDVADAYAILITGDSMAPAFEPGDHALVHPRLPPMRGVDVIIYEISPNGEARATIKRLVSWTDTDWHLQQWNPAKTFKLGRDKWQKLHRVVGKFSRR